jgi:hypothetical protein
VLFVAAEDYKTSPTIDFYALLYIYTPSEKIVQFGIRERRKKCMRNVLLVFIHTPITTASTFIKL